MRNNLRLASVIVAAVGLAVVVPVAGCDTAASGGMAGDGGTAARGGLIRGDAATCPARVPTPDGACTAQGASCTYQGGTFGLAITDEPITCTCTAGAWRCVGTDANGVTDCPPTHPPTTSCASALECFYPLPIAIDYCSCTPGTGGAGGSGAEPWLCAL